jgi:hypothetical protein
VVVQRLQAVRDGQDRGAVGRDLRQQPSLNTGSKCSGIYTLPRNSNINFESVTWHRSWCDDD